MVLDAAITTEHGFPLTMDGDPLARVCAACGKDFYFSRGQAISRFTGILKSGGKSDRGPRRYCSTACAAKHVAVPAGVGANRTKWQAFRDERAEKRCYACGQTLPVERFRRRSKGGIYAECIDCRNQYAVKKYGEPKRYFSVLISGAKSRAKKLGLPFNLSRKWAMDTIEAQGWKCYYSGVDLTIGGGHGTVSPCNASLDRLDPKSGYTAENVVICASAVNIAKNIWTIDDLLAWADRIRAWRSQSTKRS